MDKILLDLTYLIVALGLGLAISHVYALVDLYFERKKGK